MLKVFPAQSYILKKYWWNRLWNSATIQPILSTSQKKSFIERTFSGTTEGKSIIEYAFRLFGIISRVGVETPIFSHSFECCRKHWLQWVFCNLWKYIQILWMSPLTPLASNLNIAFLGRQFLTLRLNPGLFKKGLYRKYTHIGKREPHFKHQVNSFLQAPKGSKMSTDKEAKGRRQKWIQVTNSVR